jgi:hypothetical protein
MNISVLFLELATLDAFNLDSRPFFSLELTEFTRGAVWPEPAAWDMISIVLAVLSTFRGYMPLPSSESEYEWVSMYNIHAPHTLRPWRWRRHEPPKHPHRAAGQVCLNSHLGGGRFESRSGHRLSWESFRGLLQSLKANCAHESFHHLSLYFIFTAL